jgi:hypothetical protein
MDAMLDNVEWRGLAVILSPFVALAGVLLGYWLERKHTKETAAELRREHAAALLASVKATIMDADPDRLIFDAEKLLTNEVPRLEQARDRGREALFTLSNAHPSAKVSALADGAATALTDAINATTFFVLRQARPDIGGPLPHDEAKSRHAEAMNLIDELAEAIRHP